MKDAPEWDERPKQRRERHWVRWLLLAGAGIVLMQSVKVELPALRRLWNLERM